MSTIFYLWTNKTKELRERGRGEREMDESEIVGVDTARSIVIYIITIGFGS